MESSNKVQLFKEVFNLQLVNDMVLFMICRKIKSVEWSSAYEIIDTAFVFYDHKKQHWPNI